MRCRKCGQETIEGAQTCQRCGARLGEAERRDSLPPIWFRSRFIGAFAVIAAVIAIVGVFSPWASAAWTSGDPAENRSADGSGWELMTAGGDVEEGPEAYAIIGFAGAWALLLGALWAMLDPLSKAAWFVVLAGAAAAIAGSVWGAQSAGDIVFAGAGNAAVTISRAWGLYLTLAGGIAGALASIVGRLGASEPRIRL